MTCRAPPGSAEARPLVAQAQRLERGEHAGRRVFPLCRGQLRTDQAHSHAWSWLRLVERVAPAVVELGQTTRCLTTSLDLLRYLAHAASTPSMRRSAAVGTSSRR